MSYCRWSSMDWKCDLYCYEDVSGGYTIHVADNRIKGDIPTVPILGLLKKQTTPKEFAEAYGRQMEAVNGAKRTRIKLPYAGKSLHLPDLRSFYEKLEELRRVGYIFPDSVLERVRRELAEEGGERDETG